MGLVSAAVALQQVDVALAHEAMGSVVAALVAAVDSDVVAASVAVVVAVVETVDNLATTSTLIMTVPTEALLDLNYAWMAPASTMALFLPVPMDTARLPQLTAPVSSVVSLVNKLWSAM